MKKFLSVILSLTMVLSITAGINFSVFADDEQGSIPSDYADLDNGNSSNVEENAFIDHDYADLDDENTRVTHKHTLVAHPAKDATETENGNIVYWECTGCGKYFSDPEGKNEITDKSSVIIPAKGKVQPPTQPTPEAKTDTAETKTAESKKAPDKLIAKASFSGKKIKVSWNKISGAKGYDVYLVKCGGGKISAKKNLVKSVKVKKTSVTIKKYRKKALKKNADYKVVVKAYKLVNGKKKYIQTSPAVHFANSSSKKYTNAKSVKVSKKKVTIKVGKTKKIKAKTVKQDSKKEYLSKKHAARIRYYSNDKTVATVNKNGKITAKSAGTCKIYVIAQNGEKTVVKVTVK